MKRKLALVLMLVLMLLMLVPFEALAQSVVDSNVAAINFQDNRGGRRVSFYDTASGRHCVFFLEGNYIYYSTSLDTVSWTTRTNTGLSVGVGYYASGFSIAYDGTNIHIAYCAGSSALYRMGTLASNGLSITWAAVAQVIATGGTGRFREAIAIDSDGYPWVTFAYHSGSTITPYAYRSSTKNGNWTTDIAYQLNVGSANWVVRPISLASRHMLILYNGDSTSKARRYIGPGSSWVLR